MMTGATPSTAIGYSDRPAPQRMIPRAWRPLTLRGFATVKLTIGLKVRDVPVRLGPNGPRTSLPAKPLKGRPQTRSERPGAPHAGPRQNGKALCDRFSAAVVDLDRVNYPGALEG
jgi:hypothetical protein